jgi:4-hydroxy-tetrahydrodipicolinate synthase
MEPKGQFNRLRRREFLRNVTAAAAAFTVIRTGYAAASDSKPLRGLFPIGQTPFTPDNKLDLECLAAEMKFCNRGGVHGFAWPQIASGWSTLSESERLEGAEALIDANKGGKTALVIGVQTKGSDLAGAIRYAKHAAGKGADAVISLPPEKADDKAMLEYYKALGAATELPLFVQSQGDMSVDLIVEMFKQIPTMKVVKDEAGDPLVRVTEIRERTGDKLAVFSGNGVRTMIDEMRLGFSGHCPTTGLADLYAQTFDLWHAGKRREAFDMFGRIQAFSTIPNSGAYVLVARGVFKETTKSRPTPGMGTGGGRGGRTLDEAGKKVIRDALETYLKPYLRA